MVVRPWENATMTKKDPEVLRRNAYVTCGRYAQSRSAPLGKFYLYTLNCSRLARGNRIISTSENGPDGTVEVHKWRAQANY
jgi:hypothetical protein